MNNLDQAEKLRNIIRLQNNVISRQARIITVTSGKGGVGKSSVSINLAMQFRKQGKSVIIFDADFGLANIEVMFGAIPKYNLSDLIYKGKEFKDIIVKGPMDIGFISGGSGITKMGNMTKEQISYLVLKLKELEALADIIIIDTGAGISDSVLEFVTASSEVILVTTPEPTSITDSYALLKALNYRSGFDKEGSIIKLIANRVSGFEEGQAIYNKLNVVVKKFLEINLEFLGVIPYDFNITKSVIQQKPVSLSSPNSIGAKAITQIADNLLNGSGNLNSNIFKQRSSIAQVFMNIFRERNK